MKNNFIFSVLIFISTQSTIKAEDFPNWQFNANTSVATNGLCQIKLTPEIIGASRTDLADIRIADSNNNTISFALFEPREEKPQLWYARVFRSVLEQKATIVEIETGSGANAIDQVTVYTPSQNFLKPVSLEASQDKKIWRSITSNEPLFSKNGCEKKTISIPASPWAYLRLKIRDDEGERIPITNVSLRFANNSDVSDDVFDLELKERSDMGTATRFVANLPAKNLYISKLEILCDDPVYQRGIRINRLVLENNELRDVTIANGSIFKFPVSKDKNASENIIPIQQKIPDGQLILVIQDGMSSPLTNLKVRVNVTPAFLQLHASQAQTIQIWTGNKNAPKPNFDMTNLSSQWPKEKNAVPTYLLSPMQRNPNYQAPDVLPSLKELASPIDISDWRARKLIQITTIGVQELEMDMETLALAQTNLEDLRIVQAGDQIPYILGTSGSLHFFTPVVTPINSDNPKESQYEIKLPYKDLRLDEISVTLLETLFQRNAYLEQVFFDDRGEKQRVRLSQTTWMKKPGDSQTLFRVPIHALDASSNQWQGIQRLQTDRLLLVIENGDNPPLNLSDVKISYRCPKLIFKSASDQPVWLYFKNDKAERPRYDINLVKEELIGAEKNQATLGPKEDLGPKEWWTPSMPQGVLKYVFWGVLGIITLILIIIIAKLLPEGKKDSNEKLD